MKQKRGREWVDMGPASPAHSLLSTVLPSRHTHGGLDFSDERTVWGFTFPEKGKQAFQSGIINHDIGTHEIPS